jgi:hypothetical protein
MTGAQGGGPGASGEADLWKGGAQGGGPYRQGKREPKKGKARSGHGLEVSKISTEPETQPS